MSCGQWCLCLQSVASSATSAFVPWGAADAACEGLGARIQRDGSRVWRDLLPRAHWWGWESSLGCGDRQRSSFSSFLPALPVPAPKREGRKEREHPGSLPRRKSTYPPGKRKHQDTFTHPSTYSPPHPRCTEAEFCKWFKTQVPQLRLPGCMSSGQRAGTLIAARQNPPACGGCVAQSSSPQPPLLWGAASRSGNGGG